MSSEINWSNKVEVMEVLGSTPVQGLTEIWNEIPDLTKSDSAFLWEAIATNKNVSSILTTEEKIAAGFDSNGILHFSLFIKSDNLFGADEASYWSEYENEGTLRFDCDARDGALGIQGEMDLWLAPVDHDIEAWEASRLAGQDDHWACLTFLTIPSGGAFQNPKVILFFSISTFFERSLEVVKTIDLERDDLQFDFEEDLPSSIEFLPYFIGLKRGLENDLGARFELPGRRKFHF